ncbi:hypothetical protein MnTg02_01051 [bacterium MnTg02]|nr:hypothetical protein MnTg02_01051 [bacterium MnTg02]
MLSDRHEMALRPGKLANEIDLRCPLATNEKPFDLVILNCLARPQRRHNS